jgi:hypothetical protein
MKRRWFVLIGFIVAASVLAAPISAVPGALSSGPRRPEGSADAWVRQNYNRALDLALPDRCASSTDARWLVCIRIVPGYADEIEYSLSLEKRYDGTIRARIVKPKGDSIRRQLLKWKKKHPSAAISGIGKLFAVESLVGDQHSFPRLPRLADEFEQIRLSPVPADEIMMDATHYQFRVRSSSGDQLEFELQGPGSAGPRQSQVLIRWAESLRELLATAIK